MPSAVVFGARNLGGAIARGLLADGYRVASVARTKADLDGSPPKEPSRVVPT